MLSIKQLRKSFTLQLDHSDCGIACLLSIIKFYGGHDTIENIRHLSGAQSTGTTLLGLYQAAKQLGFDAEGCESNIDILGKYNSPCILYIQGNHYIICYGTEYKNNVLHFIVGDPTFGLTYLNEHQLM